MKILVTGATGFIGERLVKSFIAKPEHQITCLIRKTSNTSTLKELGVSMAVCDITDAGAVERVFKEILPEAVFHSAAGVMEKNEDKLNRANIEGTRNIAQASYAYKVSRLIYLSSVAVVSGNSVTQYTDDLPYEASNAYGRSKIEAERIVIDYRGKGLKSAIIRPCIVYGENEPHALDKIFKRIKSHLVPILNIPEMDSELNLVYVGNVVEALELALEKEEATSGTFIIADRETITFRKFLEILYNEMDGSHPPRVPGFLVKVFMAVPYFRNKVRAVLKDRVYDITRALDLLGYDPQISTEEGLMRTVKYWKKGSKLC